jgi:phosphotransferase system HPr (HPr) family protein
MPEPRATRSVVVANPEGLHARVAVAIAQTVRRGNSRVTLTKGEQRAEAIDVLQVLAMGTAQGERLEIEAAGPDAVAVLDALEPLFAPQFGSETQNSPAE